MTTKTRKKKAKSYRILIVDDDELVVESFERVFQEYDKSFEIDKTTDSKKALRLIESDRYDLVITDLVMPEVDGIQVLRKVKEVQPAAEVILITAYSSTGSALDAMHFGAFDYITKPFDFAELKTRITRALKKQDAVLEKQLAVEEIERLCYTIAHDFKAALVSIKGFSKILIQDYANVLDREGTFLLERINTNIQNLESMVEGLLEYAKIGKCRMKRECIDTNDLIEELAINYSPVLKEHDIELVIEQPLPEVYFDRNGLRQIFSNLIDNAIKYSSTGVHSYIKIDASAAPRSDGRYHQFCVEDNGIGIPPRNITTIFEIFQQGDTAPHKKGHGVGLAVVKKLLETMSCTIWAESESGKPTRFCFTLPSVPPDN
jgi:two-component system sensor histidine kinase/response regulator